ncbi:hypothetical protein F8M41_018532 [Gigaspora margarita]|uniref:Uncharacterized protein n=1 Tax=Gigaspora margarita TaxID=4874 RepID=A0A8H4ELC8_GIGMA|nr:hypothetical protein F8M41_018532 [Gigaspora margarita]
MMMRNIENNKEKFQKKEVKNKYQKLTEEYGACMRDLGIAIAISNQNNKFIEAKKVDKVLKNTEKTLENLDYTDHKFDALAKYIEIIKEFIKHQINKLSYEIPVNWIEPNELKIPKVKRENDI